MTPPASAPGQAESDAKGHPAPVPRLNRVARLVVAFIVFMMMMVTVVDVAGRYLFNAPLFGALEITEILMGLLVFAGLPLATAGREHISISLLSDALPVRLAAMQTRLFDAVCAIISMVVAWRMWIYAERLVRSGEHTQQLHLSVGMVVQAMTILLGVTAVVFLVNALGRQRVKHDPTDISTV
ncbi:MAG TPA: TRAP transporter small permease [Burkholderiaceae bacterium]|nr:TRAP transporter small permease [Burkholderiaceae bacterium]